MVLFPSSQPTTTGALLTVIRERAHQIELGFDAAHDDSLPKGDLERAAWCYLSWHLDSPRIAAGSPPPAGWPWRAEDWRPSDDPRQMRAIIAALLVAETDRDDRQAEQEGRQ